DIADKLHIDEAVVLEIKSRGDRRMIRWNRSNQISLEPAVLIDEGCGEQNIALPVRTTPDRECGRCGFVFKALFDLRERRVLRCDDVLIARFAPDDLTAV